jgi:hypothetical protein
MAAAKPEAVSKLEINSIAEKFRRISPILLDIYVAEIVAEHVIHKGNCEIQNGRLETGSNYNFGHIIDRNAISTADTMFSRVANTSERRPAPNTSCVYVKFNIADWKPEVAITLFVVWIGMRSQRLIP